jgi:hypothetical protein
MHTDLFRLFSLPRYLGPELEAFSVDPTYRHRVRLLAAAALTRRNTLGVTRCVLRLAAQRPRENPASQPETSVDIRNYSVQERAGQDWL